VLRFLFLVLFLHNIFSQTSVTIVVDDFNVSSGGNALINIGDECVGGHSAAELTDDRITVNAAILGGARDLYATATTGCSGVIQSSVAGGNYTASTSTLEGVAVLQYDGNDGSITLTPGGLGGLNFKASNGFGFRIPQVNSDNPTYVVFRVYSGSASDFCSFNQSIVRGDQSIAVNFTQFTNTGAGCNFSSVGALEIATALINAADVVYGEIDIIGPTPVSATPSTSHSPSNSPSNSPSKAASASPSPSRIPASASNTPSPSGCKCTCPKFECYMFQYSSTTFYGYVDNIGKRDVNEEVHVRDEDEGFFSFLKFF